jgi:hypothetical protein
MTYLTESFLFIFLGIIAVTIIDVIGSITSRKLNYNYAYLTPLSFIVYTLIGYFVSQNGNLYWALLSACIVGIYDGTVGWKLAVILNANFGRFKEQNLKMNIYSRVFGMIAVGTVFGYLGYIMSKNIN